MRSKKGFTLIELLAVIVILAVIALIATPIIMNVISDSKEGAAKDAMYGYVKAIELSTMKQVTATNESLNGSYITRDGNLYNGDEKLVLIFMGRNQVMLE